MVAMVLAIMMMMFWDDYVDDGDNIDDEDIDGVFDDHIDDVDIDDDDFDDDIDILVDEHMHDDDDEIDDIAVMVSAISV